MFNYMKKCCRSIVLSLIFTISLISTTHGQPIKFYNGNFISSRNISTGKFSVADIQKGLWNNVYYTVIQFSQIPDPLAIKSLQLAGIELHDYISGKAYLATIQNNFDFSSSAKYQIVSIDLVPPVYKQDIRIQNYVPGSDKKNLSLLAIGYYGSVNKETIIKTLTDLGAVIIPSKIRPPHTLFVSFDKLLSDKIASLPFISTISLQNLTDKSLNYNSRAAHGVSGLNAALGKNLNGRGVTIGVGDNADISTHIDFANRLINRSPALAEDHGTHTSGTAAGAGIIDVRYHGMAPKSTILLQYFSDIITNAPAYVSDNHLVVSNNSYFTVEENCPGERVYDVLSNYADQQLNDFPQLLHVIASGNDGNLTCSPYGNAFGTVKSGWQTAKNVLTVGALKTQDYSIAYFSSRGPVNDGRIKPEITSGGWLVMSSNAYNTYGYNFGTSMACPAVTGSIALMYERYRQLHNGADPTADLMKALVCNTAEDLGNPGPDYTFGFGMLNARRAVAAIDSNRYFINTISNGGNANHQIHLNKNAQQLKVMLYWADKPAAINAAATLVNDLDLTVTTPTSVVHHPLILNPNPANVNDNAAEGVDHVNNIEQVVINNPIEGNYSVGIAGATVPYGPQQYVLSYEILDSSVTVEYPIGGETLVPGETENIRWNAYGVDDNSFTLEYSLNNGNSWTLIDNNVSSGTRIYPWLVPAAFTGKGLIRVSRNGSSLKDVSDFNFTILGQPTITVNNVCEGAVKLNWRKVDSAQSYDILQLTADSMRVIGNTSDTSYLLKGLNKNSTVWLGVAAKNGLFSGRRSISVSSIPNNGPCTLPDFTNDLTIDSIIAPATARQFYSNAADALQHVQILIKNVGAVPVTGICPVSFSYEGGSITESPIVSIPSGSSVPYTFNAGFTNISSGFNYHFKSWVSRNDDPNHLNDTAYKVVKNINNDPITTMPVKENFENMPSAAFDIPEMAIGENKWVDFSANTIRGRARTFINTGFAHSGNKAITLDQAPYSDNSNTDTLTVNYNLQNYSNSQLRFDFYYKNHGQAAYPGNKVWVRGSENDNWLEAYDLYANQGDLGEWKQGVFNINDILQNAVPAQNVSPTFQIRIGQEGNNSANSPNPQVDYDDGYTIDDLSLNEAFNDIGLLKITSPDRGGCALGTVNGVGIRLKNYNAFAVSNVNVYYRVNGGNIIHEVIPGMAANQTLDYVFNQTVDLSAYIDYNISAWINYAPDTYQANDSALNYVIHNSPVISQFPYLEHFELSDGNYYTAGVHRTWAWGTPSKTLIYKAANGNKCWTTNLTGNYSDNETSYLYSPCFDLSHLTNPVLSFSHIYALEPGYDYSWVEYSTDGVNWNKMGNNGEGTNWYDSIGTNSWGGINGKWHVASLPIPVHAGNVHFRFVMSSDGGVNMEGLGIDDISIHEKSTVPNYAPLIFSSQNNVSGSQWIPFNWGDQVLSPWYVLAEINPNGQNLGTVNVSFYPNNTGSSRWNNGSYYLDRNWVIQSSNPPTRNIGIRLYFTDIEADSLIKAGGCSSCIAPTDAYQPGVNVYKGTGADENNQLLDDSTGYFHFMSPEITEIIPHGNGYYAECTTPTLGEFWCSMGPLSLLNNSDCPGDTMTFKVSGNGNSYQWQEDNGSGFVDISDGPQYRGTQSATLQLISLPANFGGYHYRCLTDGVYSSSFPVKLNNYWTGAVDTNWTTAGNWSCGSIPDSHTDVIIPGGLSKYPILGSDTIINSIVVYPGANMTISDGYHLTLKGN